MRKPRNKPWRITVMALGLSASIAAGKAKPSATPEAKAFSTLQNKECGYSLRYPKNAKLEIQEGCTLKITLPLAKGQEWIEEANLTLEVSTMADGEQMEGSENGDGVTGTLVAGGLKFKKSVLNDRGAGQNHVIVSYTATGKSHQYHWTGFMTATDPGNRGKPIKDWSPEKSAQKLFDGIVSGFRPIE